jgi:hypothetical protein
MGKGRVPPCWVVMAGAILEIIGITLLSRISTSTHIDSTQYGFQVLAGIGTGFINAGLIILVPYIMEKRDLGEQSTSHHEAQLLTSHSCWFFRTVAIPNSRWPSRSLHCRLSLHALYSLAPGWHRPTGDGATPSREDGNHQDAVSRSFGARPHTFCRELQPPDPNFDWFRRGENTCNGADVDQRKI